MNRFIPNHWRIVALSAAFPLALLSSAHGQTLNFQLPDTDPSVGDQEILSYYNGGADQNGAIGPSDGVVFNSNAVSLLNYGVADPGLSNTGDEPDGSNASLTFFSGPVILDVASGFTTGVVFDYTSPYFAYNVSVYSGLDGTGSLLASDNLANTYANFPIQPYYGGGPGGWGVGGASFSGTAESVVISGDLAGYAAFSGLTLGSAPAVPDTTGPVVYLLAALGLAGASWASRRRLAAAI
jgi:hypothetical protein